MELRHIRYFVAVAEELNFTRAAARLGIGQPPLSQQIKDLEIEIGVTLLRRVPHGAELTDAGRTFLDEGRRVLAASEAATVSAKRAARGEFGRLRLGFTSSAHFNAAVPTVIRDFSRRYPEVELQLEEAHTNALFDRLESGALDVAFTHSALDGQSRLHLVPVHEESLVVVLPVTHRCAGQAAVPLSALIADRFIMKPRHVGPALHKAVFDACRDAGFEPHVGQEAPQLATVISLVAAELGVSVVPQSMQHIKVAGVAYAALEGAVAHVTLSLAWRRQERSGVVGNFIALVRQSVPQSSGSTGSC